MINPKNLARLTSSLSIFQNANLLWEANQKNFWLYLNKWQKIYVGVYIILKDYSEGIFPPSFEDQEIAHQNEKDFFQNLPGVNPEKALETDMRKPFWFSRNLIYIQHFIKLCKIFDICKIYPPQRILEIGAGTGWMAEFFAIMDFEVIATTIGDNSLEQIARRKLSIEQKGLDIKFDYYSTPMESVEELLASKSLTEVNVVYVFEALHHAYDYKKTLKSCFSCLKSGGWLIICNEPNLIHTFVSYRIAKLSKTHEIGINGSELIKQLKIIGFNKILKFSNFIDFKIMPHWIAAQK